MKNWGISKAGRLARNSRFYHTGCSDSTYGFTCNKDANGWYCAWCQTEPPEEWQFCADLARCWNDANRMKREKRGVNETSYPDSR